MENEVNELETTKNGDVVVETEDIVEEEIVDETKEESVEFDGNEEDETGDKVEETDSQEKLDKKAQTKEENHRYAEMRRKEKAEKVRLAEEKALLEKQAYNKGIREALNGKNPYTNEDIQDDDDLEEFKNMQEMEKRGLDPITDYAKFIKDKRKEDRQKEQLLKEKELETEKAAEENKQKITQDIKDFTKKYDDIDVKKLLQENERFIDYADGKIGQKPLIEIYEGFLKFEKKTEETAEEIAIRKQAKKITAGSLSGEGNEEVNSEYYTLAQIKKMTVEQIRKNYTKVVASQKFRLKNK